MSNLYKWFKDTFFFKSVIFRILRIFGGLLQTKNVLKRKLLSIFLSIVLAKMLSIMLGLLLAAVLVGSRIQGWRNLEYIRFKNSVIVFFSYLAILKLKTPENDYCNFATVLSVFLFVLIKTSCQNYFLGVFGI